jgi:hypothetical protein
MSIPIDVASDFNADSTNGSVPFTKLGDDKIRIHDKNEHVYDIWYRLKATCSDRNPIYSDPRVRNTGK